MGDVALGNEKLTPSTAQGLGSGQSYVVTLGIQTSGTFTLTFNSLTTAVIAYNAAAADVRTALGGIMTKQGVYVNGPTGGPYTIVLTPGVTSGTTGLLTATFSSLSTPANASVAQNVSWWSSTWALIEPEGQAIRWRDDGVAPTATVGNLLGVGSVLTYAGRMPAMQIISVAGGGTVDVSWYRSGGAP